ncbi:MAG: histidine kinase [Bacteroidota bacterium]|nr:histidine kinase [Bacteroidota bacterium]MDP4191420.1 histidine kinase [Bacteroidota bacterium]
MNIELQYDNCRQSHHMNVTKDLAGKEKSFLYDKGFRVLGIPVIGIIVYLIIIVISPSKEALNAFKFPHLVNDISLAIVISIAVWEGNLLINKRIDRYLEWKKQPLKRIFYQILFNAIYTKLVILTAIIIDLKFIEKCPFDTAWPFIKLTIFVAIIVFLLIQAIYVGMYFFRQWENSRFESEELKRQNLQSQFEALKSQVNPHFLFNSLNALTTLIYEDQKLAVDFVQQIANVYRYVLQSKDKELIGLKEEADFIRAFLFLQKIRFGENIKETIEIPAKYNGLLIAPLTMQMLIENAIKHNIISSERPLFINIFIDEDEYLVVSNNIQRKNITNSSTGIGLDNIRQRYSLLVQKEIEVISDNKQFLVRIPLI